MKYDLTVIIPFYNASKFINNSFNNSIKIIKNINAQIIYVDDKSKDNGYISLKKKINNKANILLLKSKKNLGPGNARNIGLKKASGKKIIFLDVEDYLVAPKLKRLIYTYKEKKYNLIHYKHVEINKKNKVIKKRIVSQLASSSNEKNLILFLRKENEKSVIFTIFEKQFIINHKLKFKNGYHEDIFFLFQCLFYNKNKIKSVNDIIYKKYHNTNSITNTFSLKHIKDMFGAWKNILIFLKKKLSKKKFDNIKTHIQYRLRGELVNEYDKIYLKSKNKKHNKFLSNFLIHNYSKIIDPKFEIKTKKDRRTSILLLNKGNLLN